MNKIILLLLVITSLISCQSTKLKENPTIENTEKLDIVEVNDWLNKLNSCYQNEQCKTTLDIQLPDWLLDKNYILSEEPVITDENDNKESTKNSTSLNAQSLIELNLSSNYMNNELVRGALNEWLTWKRPQLINTWHYYQYLREDMIAVFNSYSIKETLILAIMAQESGGKVHSRSRAGAGGLFQLMPATARRLGLNGKLGAYDLRFNPAKSAFAAAKYISEQKNNYDNDEAKVLAAYNSGETRFKRLNKKYKNKSIWDKNFYYELPRETRHYIPVVIAAMLIFQNPQKFNVKLDQLDTSITTIKLQQKSSLSALAVCLGQEQRSEGWFRIIRNLNSGIKADSSVKANTELKIPAILANTFESNCKNGALMQLADTFHNADFKENTGVFRYRVKEGDSLGKIAHKFRCTSKKEIAHLNNLKAPRYLIRAGKYLKVPQC